MAWIDTIGEEQAEGDLRALYSTCPDPRTGRVDNIVKVHSLHPEGLGGHLALYRAVMRGSPGLSRLEREMIAVVVSVLNGCHY